MGKAGCGVRRRTEYRVLGRFNNAQGRRPRSAGRRMGRWAIRSREVLRGVRSRASPKECREDGHAGC